MDLKPHVRAFIVRMLAGVDELYLDPEKRTFDGDTLFSPSPITIEELLRHSAPEWVKLRQEASLVRARRKLHGDDDELDWAEREIQCALDEIAFRELNRMVRSGAQGESQKGAGSG
jgi:hypothetical protein